MSSRKESLKRLKRLDKATKGHAFIRHYSMDGEEEEDSEKSFPLWIIIAVAIATVLTIGILLWFHYGSGGEDPAPEQEPQVEAEEVPTPEPTMLPLPSEEPTAEDPTQMVNTATFLQGPKGWKKKKDWSGVWGDSEYDGRRFGGFGCGLCVMANLYTSLTPYQCSPIDMYYFAKKASFYEGASAIDWPPAQMTLGKLGMTTEIGRKPKKYEKFRQLIADSMGAMVVVCSYNDDSYWKYTPGHYVSILGYNSEDDTIFLGDSGDLKHNRSWIPLRTVYNAIKTSNDNHYLRVLGYDESKDEWKHKKINGKWTKPSYWKR
ncbi:MAG: hypothetical protein IKQ97_04385 [Eubacterium sp.]|nr:hypothetical protein [Eubacterium sp.]